VVVSIFFHSFHSLSSLRNEKKEKLANTTAPAPMFHLGAGYVLAGVRRVPCIRTIVRALAARAIYTIQPGKNVYHAVNVR
jgi:hypothetical protein